MATTINNSPPLRLDPVAGPSLRGVVIEAGNAPAVVGRSSQSQVVLADRDGTVSRRHAEITLSGGAWWVNDQNSRHGTILNGVKLTANTPAQLRSRDRLRIGPWTFRVSIGTPVDSTEVLNSVDDRGSTLTIQRVGTAELGADAQKRLDLLMECAAAITATQTEDQLATKALDALIAGTGFPRAAMLRLVGDNGEQVQVVATRGTTDSVHIGFSRSLLHAASEGKTVVLSTGGTANYGQSILSLNITSALCAPIIIDSEPDAYLYLDSRGIEGAGRVPDLKPEATAFCQAVARLCGLALSNQQRRRLQHDEERRGTELAAAREVQRLIMPVASGASGKLAYQMHSRPGRNVAGDLFDFIRINDHSVAVLVGDVEGKGVAAGMLMANVQAHVSRLLVHTGDPAASLAEVNRLLARYSLWENPEGADRPKFLTLWAGIINTQTNSITYVDAGHGHWLLRPAGGPPELTRCIGGLFLGVDSDTTYSNETIPFEPGARLILYTDGVTEQASSTKDLFGVERAIEALTPASGPEEDVKFLLRAITAHAGFPETGPEMPFNDDVTIASIALSP